MELYYNEVILQLSTYWKFTLFTKHREQGRINWGLGRFNPQRNLQTPEKIQPQGMPFLPTDGTIFRKFSLAGGIYSLLITKMSFFINEMCHFKKFVACGGLWLWASLAFESSKPPGQALNPPIWKFVDPPLKGRPYSTQNGTKPI